MIYYYLNPKTQDLIIYDTNDGEIFIVERIEKVRVMTRGDIQLGDFGKEEREEIRRGGQTQKGRGKRRKLTPETIEKIEELSAEGKSGSKIAKELGLSPACIYKYLRE